MISKVTELDHCGLENFQISTAHFRLLKCMARLSLVVYSREKISILTLFSNSMLMIIMGCCDVPVQGSDKPA